MDDRFAKLLTRLETVTQRLESLDPSGPSAKTPPPQRPHSSGGGPSMPSASAAAYDALVDAKLQPWLRYAEAVGPDTHKQAAHVAKAFRAQRKMLDVAAACRKPSQDALQRVIADTSAAISATQTAVDRRSKDFNCLNAVGEGIAALGWVVVEPAPAPYVEEMRNAADFYNNKVLMEFRNDSSSGAKARVGFATAWKELLVELGDFVKEHHRTGLTWNPRGVNVADYKSGSHSHHKGSSSSAPSKGAPPPPPPPPPRSTSPPPEPSGGAGMSAVFSELNKGSAVTSGLRHVKKGDKGLAPPPASKHASAHAPTPKASSAPSSSKPARKALEGKKWLVEYFKNDNAIVVDKASIKETVYVYRCENCTVQVKGKVNQITVDGCKRVSIVFDSVMAGFEVVNSSGTKAQALGSVGTISVDKCEGTQLIMSEASLHADVISAKSSELNIIVPGKTPADDYKEHPIPEQFVSKFVKGKYVTTALEHAA